MMLDTDLFVPVFFVTCVGSCVARWSGQDISAKSRHCLNPVSMKILGDSMSKNKLLIYVAGFQVSFLSNPDFLEYISELLCFISFKFPISHEYLLSGWVRCLFVYHARISAARDP